MEKYNCEECLVETYELYTIDSVRQGVDVVLELCKDCKQEYDKRA